MKHRSPGIARRFLLTFLRDDLAEEVLGDMEEKFRRVALERSAFAARLNYWYQVFHYLRPFAVKRLSSYNVNNAAMLENYFKVAWRNIQRQKMYSAIKVGGFALGIAACLLIALYIRHELSFDKHYPRGERIYRVVEIFDNQGTLEKGVHLPAPWGPTIKNDFPEIEEYARINPVELFGAGDNDVRRDGQVENTHEEGFVWADPSFLQMLDIPFIYGDPATALSAPNTMVITKSRADKYFPDQDPVGKQMIVANDAANPFTIGGVIADLRETSHLNYHFFMTLAGKEFGEGEQTRWLQSNYPTYLLLKPGADPVQLEKKLLAVGEKYYLPKLLEIQWPNAKDAVKKLAYHLQPISDIYLNEVGVHDGLNHGDIRFIWLSGAIAVFILLIACVNFVNLSTAKSANRAREVGLRKVVGSFRSNLVSQFLSESMLFSFFSFVAGVLLAQALLPLFSVLTGTHVAIPFGEWWFMPLMLAGVMIVGIVAGLYPSFYLSSFRPIDVLKGSVAQGSRNSGMRSLLVVFQFTTSIILIIGTVVIYRQMQHILTSKVGFDKEQVLLIQGADLLAGQVGTFRDELVSRPGVVNASVSDYLPVRGTKRNGNSFSYEGKSQNDPEIPSQFWLVDHHYIPTLGMKILEGRNFSKDMPTDADAAIINQAMARATGLKDIVGKKVRNYKEWTVIGVVEDFHFENLKEKVRPLCLVLGNSPSIVSVKVEGANVSEVLESVAATWKKFAPQQPLRYTFLNETFARMYEDVERMGAIFTSFSVFAIIVACLGLFGLSAFMVEQRSREVSIRMVLGASPNQVFTLLTSNFIRLVAISFIIASPIAWYLMGLWLEDYVSRITIGWDIFALAGALAFIVALLTVSYQSLAATRINPATSLRSQ